MRTAVFLSLLLHVAAAFHQLHYLVVVPADLRYPSTQVACLHITCYEVKLQVKLILERSAGHELLVQETIQKEKTFMCTKFWVAPPAVDTEEIATVKLIITGKGVSIEEKKTVLIRKVRSGTFIHTDKPVYQPGQTVKFRVVTLDEEFSSLNDSISLLLQDPKDNRIEQWLNVVPQDGIADLSFKLSDEPLLGTYVISVTNSKAYSTFSVEEYVIPKFEVYLETPDQIYVLDESFPLQLCGSYTYGKAVQGKFHVSLCQKIASFLPSASKPNLCQEFHNQTDETGCFFTNVSLSSFSRDFRYYQESIFIEAMLVEDGTEIHTNVSHKLLISKLVGMVLFSDVNYYYHAGEVYRGKIKVINYHGKPLKDKTVLFTLSCGEHQFKQKYITGDSGTISFSLNTTAWNSTSVTLEASVLREDSGREAGTVDLNFQTSTYFVRPFYSSSRSFLSIARVPQTLPCDRKQALQVDFSIHQEDLEHGPKRVIFSYFVTGKRGIVHAGQKTIWVGLPRMLKGFFSIPLTFTSIYGTFPRLLVYVIFPNGKIIADSTFFSVSLCFRNKVELSFSMPETLPDSEIGLHLRAAPGSTCAVWAVDQSVFLGNPGKELSSSSIYGLFPSVFSSRYPPQVSEVDNSCGYPNVDEADIYTAFRDMGLKVMSNTKIRKPRVCQTTSSTTRLQERRILNYRPILTYTQSHRARSREHLTTSTSHPTLFAPVSSDEEREHKYFPRTWIWDLFSVGPSGKKNVTVTVPGTITEWRAGMFCTGSNGFGLAPASSLRVFKPFVVDLPLPSSVIQGETFTLKATVVSYLQRCLKIKVTLEESAHLQLKPCKGCVYSSCLCAGEAKTFQWSVTAEQLGLTNITLSTEAVATEELCGEERPFVLKQGQKDTVVKLLLVRPEGVLVEKAHSSILCPKKGNPAQEFVSLVLPPNAVEGSVRATVSVTGDLMGTALQNLDHLVQMPHGCGEQNMVLFAPVVYVLQYLEKTRQLTPEIKERAGGFLRNGYQIQLQYQHPDGSYSEFGAKDEYGNTWLTAFVLKCFVQAKPYIFIDNRTIQDALSWLEFHQFPDGCFRNVGQLFHTAMKGGVDGEIPLAAYITAAYLEAGKTPESVAVRKALGCIAPLPKVTSTYTQALLAYTFALAKDSQRTQELLEMLDQKAIREDGQIHWSQTSSKPSLSSSPWAQPLSVDVELTAYVLLALVSKPNITESDLNTASGIVAWLTRQQNAYGGFASTQDTVVALQALAKYAALTYSTKGVAEVRVRSQRGFGRQFQVSLQNRLLVQEAALTEVPGKFSVQANGSCCVFTRMVLRYNTPSPQVSTSFALRVETAPVNCTGDDRHSVTIYINVRYTGKRSIFNMVIVEVSLLSGFDLAPGSRMSLQHRHSVRRAEKTQGVIAIYLDKLSHKSETYVLQLEQKIDVTNLKPGHVRVYDYYHPEEQALADYNVFCM
ncbi:alpha-2-macroglobulin-like protein 1 [Dryobates pubescens]|uniref:alpha-2-macroglobulin-like protein 1 n=1 Tax=Dryobates pubescens TaxID=118200 RepID=UPI0023B96A47|nr:alpha-2-macroglobulin-like protein 1 [Dryobates pubescens]